MYSENKRVFSKALKDEILLLINKLLDAYLSLIKPGSRDYAGI